MSDAAAGGDCEARRSLKAPGYIRASPSIRKDERGGRLFWKFEVALGILAHVTSRLVTKRRASREGGARVFQGQQNDD